MGSDDLLETLKLEPLEMNLFRGTTPKEASHHRIYGGQVVAQALLAAYATVDDRLCHSLHAYFLRPGDPRIPIIFEVDRSRDGGSFTTRRVIAVQHGRQIFNLAASFQAQEDGLQHQTPMPPAPPPETLTDDFDSYNLVPPEPPGDALKWMARTRPLDIRTVGGHHYGPDPKPQGPEQQVWFRCRQPIGEDPRLHQVVLAYASDMTLLGTSLRRHPVNWETPGLQAASLDHAMWFHRPIDFGGWHLYHQESPSASGGRGVNFGYVYSQDGRLVATCAQEGLIRLREPKA